MMMQGDELRAFSAIFQEVCYFKTRTEIALQFQYSGVLEIVVDVGVCGNCRILAE